jgi:hypothetical protein
MISLADNNLSSQHFLLVLQFLWVHDDKRHAFFLPWAARRFGALAVRVMHD